MKIPLDASIREALVVRMIVCDRAGEESVGLVAAVDTGATVTMIPRDAARKLGYPVDSIEPERFVAGDGVFYAPRVTLGRVDIGPASAANVDAICHDLPEETTLEALVGLSFLTRFDATPGSLSYKEPDATRCVSTSPRGRWSLRLTRTAGARNPRRTPPKRGARRNSPAAKGAPARCPHSRCSALSGLAEPTLQLPLVDVREGLEEVAAIDHARYDHFLADR